MKLMLQYVRKHLGMFLIAVLFLSIETFADLLQPTFMSYIVDKGVKNQEIGTILRYGSIMLGITALGAVGAVVRNIYASKTSQLIGKEIRLAIEQGLTVLYCIGEKSEEQEQWQQVLGDQLKIGLEGVDTSRVVIAYEPIWSIGPGKTPAGKEYITKIARFVKEQTGGLDVVYGGGLKVDNAEMLSSIDEIDGGLIALTRFQGEIGFYPEEYLEIIKTYLGK